MRAELTSLVHEHYVSLYLVPETQVERELLKSLWTHGRLATTNGVCDGTGSGWCVTQSPERKGKTDAGH